MSFEHPLVLAGAPLALAWLLFAFRPRRGARAVGVRIEQRFAGARRPSTRAPRGARVRGVLAALGALLSLGALAGPQWGTIAEKSVERSREVLIALDLSRSMLAPDVSPSRLERSKLLVRSLLDQLHGEQVGLVLFAGTAFLQSPLSADHEVLRELLADLGPKSLPQGGTDYGAMLRAAVEAFHPGGEGDRYLVVLSDGEAHDEGWREELPALEQAGLRVIALGVGTPEGSVIPGPRGGVMKDEHGAAILSRLEPGTLTALAQETGGTYRDAASWVDVAALIDATVAQGAAGRYVEELGVRPERRFQWLLAPALACWLLAFWRELPVRPVRRRLAGAGAALAAALCIAAPPHAALAATAPTPGPEGPPPPGALEATVAELAAKPALAAPDYARLAEQTLAYGDRAPGVAPGLEGVVDDALLGVELGERESPGAADWPELRRRLAALKERQQQQKQERQGGQEQDTKDGQKGRADSGKGASQDRDGGAGQDQAGQGPGGNRADQGARQDRGAQQGAEAQRGEQQAQQGSEGSGSPGAASQGGGSDESRSHEARAQGGASGGDRGTAGGEDRDAASSDAAHKSGSSPDAHGKPSGQEPKPVAEPEAGLAALDSEEAEGQDAQAAERPGDVAREPGTRRVGGGGGIDAPEASEPGLVEALGRQAGVRDGDAPSVLFQRMQRYEGRERPDTKGKDW